jgi:hypothetical protein
VRRDRDPPPAGRLASSTATFHAIPGGTCADMLTTWPPSVKGESVVARKHCYAAASHCRTIKMRPTITCSDQLFVAEAYPAHATRAPDKELAHAEHRKDNLYPKRHRDQCRSSGRGIGVRWAAHMIDKVDFAIAAIRIAAYKAAYKFAGLQCPLFGTSGRPERSAQPSRHRDRRSGPWWIMGNGHTL